MHPVGDPPASADLDRFDLGRLPKLPKSFGLHYMSGLGWDDVRRGFMYLPNGSSIYGPSYCDTAEAYLWES